MAMGSVVVAGHICVDIIPDMRQVPDVKMTSLKPGQLVITGPAQFITGGAVSNTGLALRRLGIATRLVAKVGKDPLGQIIRGIIEKNDINLSSILSEGEDAATSYSIVLSSPGVDRIFFHCPGANDTFCADDIPYQFVSQARLFHFGYPPLMRKMYAERGNGLVEVFQKAKSTGVTTSLDMTFPDPESDGGKADWLEILGKVLPFVDIFMPSFEELLFMLRRDLYEKMRLDPLNRTILSQAAPDLISCLGNQILELGVKIAVIKLGDRGLYLRSSTGDKLVGMGRGMPADPVAWSDQELWSACFKVKVVGTTGAGDSTIAGFLAGMLRELSPAATMTAAVAVGACDVEAADAFSGLWSWEDTMARIEGGWTHLPLDLSLSGWKEIQTGIWKK